MGELRIRPIEPKRPLTREEAEKEQQQNFERKQDDRDRNNTK